MIIMICLFLKLRDKKYTLFKEFGFELINISFNN